MAKQYRSRELEATAIDTKTQLTTLGSQVAPGPLLVPRAATRLLAIIAATGSNQAAANDAAAIVRLEGPGLPEGPEVIVVGGHGSEGAMSEGFNVAYRLPLDIPVTPTQEILIFGEMVGEDVGQISFVVTLEFAA